MFDVQNPVMVKWSRDVVKWWSSGQGMWSSDGHYKLSLGRSPNMWGTRGRSSPHMTPY